MWVSHQNQQGEWIKESAYYRLVFPEITTGERVEQLKMNIEPPDSSGQGNVSCYGEDFFFKYSSIINACGNGGKPRRTQQ